MDTTTYDVDGMSCEHCVRAITGEVSKLDRVARVEVDLAGKTVAVSGEAVDAAAVRAAIEDAGYSVVG